MRKIFSIIFYSALFSFPQINQIILPQCADISLNDIVLHDTISSRIILGADNIILYQKNPPFEFKFFNRYKTQTLTCTFMPGDYLYSLSEFKVEMNVSDVNRFIVDSSQVKIVVLKDIPVFKSGKGIELGTDSSNVVSILGKPNEISSENGVDIFLYEIKDPIYYPNEKIDNQANDFLNLFNMPSYYGNYKFRNGKLIEFGFGFPYP
jgi:hypothetical protein